MSEDLTRPAETPLESWKAIAEYLQRDARTVRRWEASEALPVHRHRHLARSSVYAYPSELDAWRATRQPEKEVRAIGWLGGHARALALAPLMLLVLLSSGGGIVMTPAGRIAAQERNMTVRQVWAGGALDTSEGDVSPDGRYLTFVDWSTGAIGIRDLTTGENRRLTDKVASPDNPNVYEEFGEWPIVSPDGRQIAYAWFNKDKFYDLRVRPLGATADEAKPRIVFRNEEVSYIQVSAWLPSGQQVVALLQGKDSTNRIVLISLSDGSVRTLKSLEWRYPTKISVSPDGRYVAYDLPVRQDSADRDIFALSIDGSRETLLVQHPGIHHSPVWLRDGRRILFVSDRGGNAGVWVVPVADARTQGPAELIKADMGRVIALGVTRDGSYYYEVQQGTQDVFTADLDPQTGKVISAPVRAVDRFVGSNLAPAWSPDGRYLAYHSRRGTIVKGPGSLTLAIRTIETGEERAFALTLNPEGDPYPFPVLRWSGDGRSLLVSATDPQGRWSLYRVDAQSGSVAVIERNLTKGAYPPIRWALSPDGTTVYVARNNEEDKTSSIVAHDNKRGTERELYRTRPLASPYRNLALAVSADGRQLAFVENLELPRLQIIPTTGGQAREIFRAQSPYYLFGPAGIEWMPDGRHVLFLISFYGSRPEPSPASGLSSGLWRIATSGGDAEKLLSMPMGISLPSVHPDGRRLAFTTGSSGTEEVWVMQNFLPAQPR